MANKPLRIPVGLLDNAAGSGIFCLPLAGRDALLSFSERLLWDIYVDENGRKIILSDAQKAIIESTIEGLLMGCDIDMTPIGDGLQAVADAVAALECQVNNSQVVDVRCGSGSFITYDSPGSPPTITPPPLGDAPPEITDIPYPPGWDTEPGTPGEGTPPDGTTWEEYDTSACAAANAVVEYGYQVCRALADLLGQDSLILAVLVVGFVAVIQGGLGLLFSSAFVLKIADVLWRMYKSWERGASQDFFNDLADDINTNRQDYVCAIYQNRAGGVSGLNEFLALIFNAAANAAEGQADQSVWQDALQWLFPPYLFFAALNAGVDAPANAVSCDACGENAPPDIDNLLMVRVPFTGEYTIAETTGTTVKTVTVENDEVYIMGYGPGPNIYRFSVIATVDAARLLSEYGVQMGVTHKVYCGLVMHEPLQFPSNRYPTVVQMAGTNSGGVSSSGYPYDAPQVIKYIYVSAINVDDLAAWAVESGGRVISSTSQPSSGFIQVGYDGSNPTGALTVEMRSRFYWYLVQI